MHFSTTSAVGLGLMAAHATALVPGLRDVVGTVVTIVSTVPPVTVTVTTTVTGLPLTISANSTAPANSTVAVTSLRTPSTVLPTPTTPPTSGLTADQQKALDLHNSCRAEVGNGPVAWDEELVKSAQAWANNLAKTGSFYHDPNPGGQGENLYMVTGSTSNELFYSSAVQSWLDEKPKYNNQPITDKGSPNYHDYGHYTQAIWKGTYKVGIATASSGSTTVVVARYFPPGNYIGQMPW
ncbi:PR-1-like protein [Colletotrichum zoysiae]|uniref:PR-1-like protein n=1 Tax=Colletotrichum zoysiae TaxID=1216348 RepID=A0AAD9HFK5_9PEZI|nr:PR-1-like protein [Colletotrichum zoysiae]